MSFLRGMVTLGVCGSFALASFAQAGDAAITDAAALQREEVEARCVATLTGLAALKLTLPELKKLEDKEARLNELRLRNGTVLRARLIERMRRLTLLRLQVASGGAEREAAIDAYRKVFRDTEISYRLIQKYSEAEQTLQAWLDQPGRRATARKAEVEEQLEHVQKALAKAYKVFGENYAEYSETRKYLQEVAGILETEPTLEPNQPRDPNARRVFTDSTPPEDPFERQMRDTARYIFYRLGDRHVARLYPGLQIDPDERPLLVDIWKTFADPRALHAYLDHEIEREEQVARVRYLYWTLDTVQGAINWSASPLGARGQQFFTALVGLSRDAYLRVTYLSWVEAVIHTREDKNLRIERFLDFAAPKGTGDEFLDTFARVGRFSADWTKILNFMESRNKDAVDQGLSPNPTYVSMIKRMHKAARRADSAGGLSLNYDTLGANRAGNFLISNAGRAAVAGGVWYGTQYGPEYFQQLTDWLQTLGN